MTWPYLHLTGAVVRHETAGLSEVLGQQAPFFAVKIRIEVLDAEDLATRHGKKQNKSDGKLE